MNTMTKYCVWDPIYKLIELSPETKYFAEHPAFKRLKDIKQLGVLKFIHPQAVHTRYEHSLGVAYLAKNTVETLLEKPIVENSRIIPSTITRDECLCVELAALYHDIGHGPYSHSFDTLLDSLKEKTNYGVASKHEGRSMLIFRRVAEELMEKYANSSVPAAQNLAKININLVQYFIDPPFYKKYISTVTPNYTRGLEQIVNNELYKWDVDKMDYIVRDRQYLNPNNNLFCGENIIRIIKKTRIINGTWTFPLDKFGDIMSLACERFNLYGQYYIEKKSVAVSLMITDVIKMLISAPSTRLVAESAPANETILDCLQFRGAADYNAFYSLTDANIEDTILNSDSQYLILAKNKLFNIARNNNVYKFYTMFVQLEETKEMPKFVDGTVITRSKIGTDPSNPEKMIPQIPFYKDGGMEIINTGNIGEVYLVFKTDFST